MATEKRLIDAKHLSERIRKKDGIVVMTKRAGKIFDLCYTILMHFLEEEPTVDAVEVVHGRWIEKYVYDPDPHDRLRYRCSICGRTEEYRELYCHCGAKMDGDGNG